MPRRVLLFYGWLFLAGGVFFVAAGPHVMDLLGLLRLLLPGARPFPREGAGIWLGLAGSMMAMIAYLAFEAARDPGQDAAWNALLLSKGVSSGLFAAFAAATRNTLFLPAAALDGAILLHLRRLRRELARPDPFYEVWFATLHDPANGNALWVRHTFRRARGREESARWYALFDREGRTVRQGRWSCAAGEPFKIDAGATAGIIGAENGAARWDLRWSRQAAPAFAFIPRWMSLLGLASSDYAAPMSAALFDGIFEAEGRRFVFRGARGCVGHLWGRAMGGDWRWARAIFPGEGGAPDTVFEILSARGRLGPWLLPRLTFANLWHAGRLYQSSGLRRGLRNASRRDGERWRFRAEFGAVSAEGECAPDAALTAVFDYESPDGRRIRCRNSEAGSMTLRLHGPAGESSSLSVKGAAAVEYAEPLP